MSRERLPHFQTKERLIEELEDYVIPDLKAAQRFVLAELFEEAVLWLKDDRPLRTRL